MVKGDEPEADFESAAWRKEITELLDHPERTIHELPHLDAAIRTLLSPDARLLREYLFALLAAALAHGDTIDAGLAERDPDAPARVALREGVRGTLFLESLPGSEDDVPKVLEDKKLVYEDGISRHYTKSEHRRWGALRYARAHDKKWDTRGTLEKNGRNYRREFSDRLARDLYRFLEDEDAVRDYVESNIKLNDQADVYQKYQPGDDPKPTNVSTGASASDVAVKTISDRLDAPSFGYPINLTPSILAKELSLSSFDSTKFRHALERGLYTSSRSSGGEPSVGVVTNGRRSIVLGNPGSGKSTILSASVITCLEDDRPALFARLSSVAPIIGTSLNLNSALTAVVSAAVEESGADVPMTTIGELVDILARDNSALIALDGLDEVNTDDMGRVLRLVQELESVAGSVVISSRIAGYEKPLLEWSEYTVDHLSPAQARSFIDEWFAGQNPDGKSRAKTAISSPTRAGLAETPVLLGIIAAVAEDEEVPDSEAEVYERYISLFLRGKWKSRRDWLPIERLTARMETAEDLAWWMATGLTGKLDGARWTDTIPYAAIIDKAATKKPRIAQSIISRHGLLTPHGRSASELHQPYRWLHRTIHEHLVGARIADRVRSNPNDAPIDEIILMGPKQWHVPLRHMAGLLNADDHARLMTQLDALRDAGDPGLVLDLTAEVIADSLPRSSPSRRREAARRVAQSQWDVAWNLDHGVWMANVLTALQSGAEVASPYGHFADGFVPPEEFVRHLLTQLNIAPGGNEGLRVMTIRWLSAYDPDAALDELWSRREGVSRWVEFQWGGSTPSNDAIEDSIKVISSWSAKDDRLLAFVTLGTIAGDIRPYVNIYGPSLAKDAATAMAIVHGTWGDPDPLRVVDAQVHEKLLKGEYGPFVAAGAAQWEGVDCFDLTDLSPAAQVVIETRLLHETPVGKAALEDADSIAKPLSRLMSSDLHDDTQLLALLVATRAFVSAASRFSTECCVKLYLQSSEAVWGVYDKSSFTARDSAVREVEEAFRRILRQRPIETRRLLLDAQLEDWVASKEPIAHFGIFWGLYRDSTLNIEDVFRLSLWATEGGFVFLNSFDNDEFGIDLIELTDRLHQEAPETFALNQYALATRLAELGQLKPWRNQLIRAGRELDDRYSEYRDWWLARNRVVGIRRSPKM